MIDVQVDQGWSWVVNFASMTVLTLVSGCYYAYGVFLQSWMDKFKITSVTASLVGATSSGLTSITAPICSYFISRWGCRFTIVMGGLLTTVGLTIASFTQSFVMFYFSYGILSGIGFGLVYLAAIVVISKYFVEKRGIALGIALSGVGAGSFTFPFILERLTTYYGVGGAMLILAGIIFHICLCGMVMFPIRNQKSKTSKLNRNQNSKTAIPHLNRISLLQNKDSTHNNNNSDAISHIKSKQGTSNCCDAIELPNTSGILNRKSTNRQKTSGLHQIPLRFSWIRKKSSLFRLGIRNHCHCDSKSDVEAKNTNENNPLSESSLSSQSTFAVQSRALFRSPLFYVMLVSNVTMFINIMITFCLVPISAVNELGFSKDQGAFFVSIVGLANMAGRFGWGTIITLIPRIKPFNLFVTLRLVASVITFLGPFAYTFSMQTAYCALIGLCFGCWSLYPVVVSNAFGDAHLNVALGYLEPFCGIGAIIGPILGTYLLDVTGSSKTSFAVSGAIQAIGIITTAAAFKVIPSFPK